MDMPGNDSTIKVLLADDHQVVRAGIRMFLEQADDIQVIAEADDGPIAKSLIEKHQPDVVVLDIQMPGETGIEVARWTKANYPTTGILILTAYDEIPYVQAVLQAGAHGFVLKTADPEEIIQAVRNVFAGKSVIDAQITSKMISQMTNPPDLSIEAPTDREMEVLALVAEGFTNKAIGVQLDISDRTVQGHLANIFNKLHANSRTEAVMRAVSKGWLSPDIGQMKDF